MTTLLAILTLASSMHGRWLLQLPEGIFGDPVYYERDDGNEWLEAWFSCGDCVALCGPDQVYVVDGGTLDGDPIVVQPVFLFMDIIQLPAWRWVWVDFENEPLDGPIAEFEFDGDMDPACIQGGIALGMTSPPPIGSSYDEFRDLYKTTRERAEVITHWYNHLELTLTTMAMSEAWKTVKNHEHGLLT